MGAIRVAVALASNPANPVKAIAAVYGRAMSMFGWLVMDTGEGPHVRPPSLVVGGKRVDVIVIRDPAALAAIVAAIFEAYKRALAERKAEPVAPAGEPAPAARL